MASVEAAINLVVRGSGAVNRLIQDINRLEGLVESLSRSPIDITFGNANREIQRLGRAVEGTEGEIRGLQNSLNPLRQAYERTAQGVARFERANNVFNRSLEVSRRAVSLYQANIESLNRTAHGQPQRSAAISDLNSAFREGLVTQRDYARLMLRTRQEFANLHAAEAALERAQTRQNNLTLEAAQNAGSLVRARSVMAAQAQEIARGEQRIEMVRGRMATQQNLLEGAEGFRNQIDFLNRLASSYTSAGAAAARASGNLENIPRDMSRGGVRQEISVFDDLANSVNYTSDAFNRFTIASQAANLTLGQIQRQRLRVLTEAFSPSFAAGAQPLDSPERGEGAVDISNTRAAVNRLLLASQPGERAGATVQRGLVRSEAGLTLMIDQLQQLRALIPFVDADYGRLTERIAELNEELRQGTGRPDPTQRQINAELLRLADIQDRINNARLTSAQRTAVQNRYDTARAELDAQGVQASRQQTIGLVRQINAMQSLNREQEKRNTLVDDEVSKLGGRASRVGLSDIPQALKDQLLSRADTAYDLLSQGDLEGGRRVRQELERDRIQFEKSHRNQLNLEEERSSQVSRLLKLEQELNKIRLSGRNVTAQMADLDLIRSEVADAAIQPNKQLLSDSSIILDRVADYITQQKEGIRLVNESAKSTDRQRKANEDLTAITNNLKTIQGRYNELKKQGVSFGAEEAELQAQISQIETGRFVANKQNIDQLSGRLREFQSFQNLRVQEAVSTGAFTGTTQTPEKLEKERNRQLREAYGLRKTLDDLEKKGIASDLTRVDLLQQINTLEQRRGQIAADNLIAVQAEFETTSRVLDVTRTEIARLKSDIEETSKATGFGKSFQDFQEALKESRAFLGTESPAEAIDKIVREFNKDVQRAAVADAAPVQTAIRTEYEQMLDSFRNQFANLTTNPRFFGRLLSQIPDDALTASMAGAATDIAAGGRATTGVLTGIGKIPGGLESQIESAYQDAFGRVPGGVTRLFDKIASVFDALIGRRFSGAGLGGGGGGVRPPNGPGSGAGGAGSPGNFGGRLTDAEARGVGALLGLQELQKPSEVATVRLEILSNVLKDVYNQLDPTSEDAKRFNSALRRTTARLDEIVASRAPDADPLVRLTRSPRLAQGISEGLIGGAFPLLFGQGAGAAVGGGLGGFAGGFMGGALGFGLSLIGTAVGTAFDTAVQSAAELGGVLNDTAKAFDTVKERSLFSSKEVEKLASKLEEAGFSSAASILSQQEVINKIGGSGVQRLRDLGESSDRLSRAWAEFNLQLQVALAGPMAGLLEWVAGIVAESNKAGRAEAEIRDIRESLSPEGQKQLDKRTFKTNQLGRGFLGLFGFDPVQQQLDYARGLAFLEGADQKRGASAAVKLDTDTLKAELKTALEGTSSALSQELELLNIGKGFSDQFRNAIREQEDINEQAFEIRKGYEESIRNIRLGVERAVQKEALDGLRAQNELVKLQGEARIQQLRNTSAELVSAQGTDEYGRRLFEILGRAAELELSSQQNIENRKRDLELDLQAKAIETEIYKADIAKQVASLNESSAKSIANINKSIRRSNEDYDERKFGTEKEIANIRLQLMKMENEKAISDVQRLVDAYENLAPGRELNEFGRRVLESNKNYLKLLQSQESPLSKAQRAVADAQLPAKKAEVAPISTAGVSLAAFDAVRERAVAAVRAISEAQDGLASLAKQGEWIKIKDQLIELADQGFAQAAKQLSVFVGRFKDISVSGFGDEFSAPLEELEKRRLDLEALLKGETPEGGKAILDQLIKAGLDKRQATGLVELGIEITKLSKGQLEGVRTAQYYLDSASDLTQEFDSLSDQLREATQFGTQYEKTLASLVSRGLDPATEASRALLAEAEKIDILRQKVAVVEGFTFAADTLSGSMKDLVLQFVELGSASAAVKKVSDELGKKAFGFILDIAFKPVEENMRKSMLDMATKLGFDISTPQERQLKELESIRLSNDGILENLQKIVERYVGAAVAPTAAPAVSTVPSNSSRLLQTQSGLRTPEELALRDMTSYAEGTWQPKGIPGYDIKYGGGRFNTASHPGGSAAGAYQFMPGTWAGLGGGAMNPATQDLRFFELVKNRGVDAKQMINPQMIDKLSPEWAAFPTMQGRSYHNQPFKPYQDLERFYKERLDFYRNVIPAGTSQQGPQSSLPSSMMHGIGGPDLPLAIEGAIGLPESVRERALGEYERFRKDIEEQIGNLGNSETPEQYRKRVLGYIDDPRSDWRVGRPKEEVGAMQADMKSIVDQVFAQTSGTTQAAAETDKALTQVGSGITKIQESAAKDANKIEAIVPQWTKNLGMAVTGLGMAASAVVSIVGGIGSIKKGGAGNVLSGIGSILTTIGGIGMSASGFMKPAGFGPNYFNPRTGLGAAGPNFGLANGDVLDDGKLMRFANGGVLQSPTLFNFEDAGVTKTGQAGEAGVEAVMPLKRTKDGRLGVEADLSVPFESDGQFEAEDDLPASLEGEGGFASDGGQRSANGSRSPMVPFLRAGGRTGSMTATQMLQAAAEAGLPVPFTRDSAVAAPDLASLDSPIRFETLRVGELDVVTREEAEEIGRRAEARGATKGAALAQKKMQNSPATRRRSGLPT